MSCTLSILAPFDIDDIFVNSNLQNEGIAEYREGFYVAGSEVIYGNGIWRWLGANDVTAQPPSGSTISVYWAPQDESMRQQTLVNGRWVTLPLYSGLPTPAPLGSLCWVPSATGGLLEGRAWVSLQEVPTGNPPPSSDSNTETSSDWEFVRANNPGALIDIDPTSPAKSAINQFLLAQYKVQSNNVFIANVTGARLIITGKSDTITEYQRVFNLADTASKGALTKTSGVDIYLDDLPSQLLNYDVFIFPEPDNIASVGSVVFGQVFEVGALQNNSGFNFSALDTLALSSDTNIGIQPGKILHEDNYVVRIPRANYDETVDDIGYLVNSPVVFIAPENTESLTQFALINNANPAIQSGSYVVFEITARGYNYSRRLVMGEVEILDLNTQMLAHWKAVDATGLQDQLGVSLSLASDNQSDVAGGVEFSSNMTISTNSISADCTVFMVLESNTLGLDNDRILIRQGELSNINKLLIQNSNNATVSHLRVYFGALSDAGIATVSAELALQLGINGSRLVSAGNFDSLIHFVSSGDAKTIDPLAYCWGTGLELVSATGQNATPSILDNKLSLSFVDPSDGIVTYTVEDSDNRTDTALASCSILALEAHDIVLDVVQNEIATVALLAAPNNVGIDGFIEELADIAQPWSFGVRSQTSTGNYYYSKYEANRFYFKTDDIGTYEIPYRLYNSVLPLSSDGLDKVVQSVYDQLPNAEAKITVNVTQGIANLPADAYLAFDMVGQPGPSLTVGSTTVVDLLGNANGVIRGVAHAGYGVLVLGVNEDVLITSNKEPTELTIEAEVPAKSPNAVGSQSGIFAQGDNFGLYWERNASFHWDLVFYYYNGSSWVTHSVDHPTNYFNPSNGNVVVVSFGNGRVRIAYLGNTIYDEPDTGTISYTKGSDFTIGSIEGQRYLEANVYRLFLYERALTEAEIQARSLVFNL